MSTDDEIRDAFRSQFGPAVSDISMDPALLGEVRRRHTRQQRLTAVGAPLGVAVLAAGSVFGAMSLGGNGGPTQTVIPQADASDGPTVTLLGHRLQFPDGWQSAGDASGGSGQGLAAAGGASISSSGDGGSSSDGGGSSDAGNDSGGGNDSGSGSAGDVGGGSDGSVEVMPASEYDSASFTSADGSESVDVTVIRDEPTAIPSSSMSADPSDPTSTDPSDSSVPGLVGEGVVTCAFSTVPAQDAPNKASHRSFTTHGGHSLVGRGKAMGTATRHAHSPQRLSGHGLASHKNTANTTTTDGGGDTTGPGTDPCTTDGQPDATASVSLDNGDMLVADGTGLNDDQLQALVTSALS